MLIVDGHDLTRFVVSGGYAVSRNDVDGRNAGRTMDAKMHRDYITFKRKLEIKFRPLSKDEWRYIEHDILRGKPWNMVRHEDFGVDVTLKMMQSSFCGTISTVSGKRIGAAVNFIEE